MHTFLCAVKLQIISVICNSKLFLKGLNTWLNNWAFLKYKNLYFIYLQLLDFKNFQEKIYEFLDLMYKFCLFLQYFKLKK